MNQRGPGASAIELTGRLWGFCHILRHDGVDYGDYIEQLTYLLFIKMAKERSISLPSHCSWSYLLQLEENEVLSAYDECLHTLSAADGVLGEIFLAASNKITNPSSLIRLLRLVDQIAWSRLGLDVQAAVFEGLLERAAAEGKKGAGQYFTPRPLIESIVRCIKPSPKGGEGYKICDPAVGTGGFLVAALEWVQKYGPSPSNLQLQDANHVTFHGTELVQRPRRLALMNLYLHGVAAQIELGDAIYEPTTSAQFDVVLTNPPFGTKGASDRPARDDFAISTNNKQVNFLQHALTILKDGGRAAVVVPDNVLFGTQATLLFQSLTKRCDLHTILRCPDGTFSPYTEGTKTNVLFFTKGPKTTSTWIYDARSGAPRLNKRSRRLLDDTFHRFETCYGDDPNGRDRDPENADERWRQFSMLHVADANYQYASLRWLDVTQDRQGDDPNAHIEAAIKQTDEALTLLRSLQKLIRSEAW